MVRLVVVTEERVRGSSGPDRILMIDRSWDFNVQPDFAAIPDSQDFKLLYKDEYDNK